VRNERPQFGRRYWASLTSGDVRPRRPVERDRRSHGFGRRYLAALLGVPLPAAPAPARRPGFDEEPMVVRSATRQEPAEATTRYGASDDPRDPVGAAQGSRKPPAIWRALDIIDRPSSLFAIGPSVNPPIDGWEPRYRKLVIISDVLVTLLVTVVLGGFISASNNVAMEADIALGGITFVVMLCSIAMNHAWQLQVVGQGPEEYAILGRSMFAAGVALALVGFGAGVTAARPWVYIVIPVAALLTLLFRFLLRQVLHRARYEGECLLPVLAAGGVATVSDLIKRTKSAPHVGWRVDAVCTVDGSGTDRGDVDDVPVVGALDDVAGHVRRGGYRIVAVTADPYWTPRRLQRLAWQLEGSGAEMVVAPTLMEVAGPRLHVSGVLGMPLLRVSAPVFTGARRTIKNVIDRVGALVMLALTAPVMLVAAVAIIVDTRGPVLFKQRRAGRDGKEFTILKFRTMVRDADRHTKALVVNEGAGVLFKMRRDPRVTRVGAVLRRFSIDELPSLFNVLAGAMSLVGPRPPLPEEIARYEPDVRRRLLVKPGLTGLWQVSGRSDLPWEDAIRLDLQYVEDWSLALDAMILWKTVRAVISGQGAY
jgi:exopolysaccharide biosynthesis polyprenyl glycosylphosphotransferase